MLQFYIFMQSISYSSWSETRYATISSNRLLLKDLWYTIRSKKLEISISCKGLCIHHPKQTNKQKNPFNKTVLSKKFINIDQCLQWKLAFARIKSQVQGFVHVFAKEFTLSLQKFLLAAQRCTKSGLFLSLAKGGLKALLFLDLGQQWMLSEFSFHPTWFFLSFNIRKWICTDSLWKAALWDSSAYSTRTTLNKRSNNQSSK